MGAATSLLLFAISFAAESEPGLPANDRAVLEQALGEGVIGSSLRAPIIDEPAEYTKLTASRRQYRMLQGPHAGALAMHHTRPLSSTMAKYELSNEETGFLRRDADGGLVMSGIEDTYDNALTRYAPAEPFIPKGFRPGSDLALVMGVKVFDLDDPEDLQHEGNLKVVLSYLGAYQIQVPAGRYDTVLLRAKFKGQVGPAHVDDVQYRFFTKGVGLVAMVERRDVTAFVLYRDHLDLAKVLEDAEP